MLVFYLTVYKRIPYVYLLGDPWTLTYAKPYVLCSLMAPCLLSRPTPHPHEGVSALQSEFELKRNINTILEVLAKFEYCLSNILKVAMENCIWRHFTKA